MTTTCSKVEVIQNSFGFIYYDTLMHNHVNTPTMQGIAYNDIMLGLVTNELVIFFGGIWSETLSL
jgi:ubiquinone biosynthesis protein Coq4